MRRLVALTAWIGVLFALSVLPCRHASALRLPGEKPAPQVLVNTLWNREYLCLAARVPDTIVTGTSSGPMSSPDLDDAIEFCLEAQQDAGVSAHRLAISAAGGMTVLTRDPRGHWRSDSSWVTGVRTVKYAVDLNGTLNDPSDTDRSFVVECAIPWEFLGAEVPVGKVIGFNVVCWMQGENEGLVSWSPSIQTRDQVGDAARWGKMAVSVASTAEAAVGTQVTCPFVPRTPFIDGKLAAAEWLVAATLSFSKPEPAIQMAPRAAERTATVGTVLAVYRYDWQGDSDRDDGAPLWADDGAPATSDQPSDGCGPWQSYDRVSWHRAQLSEIQRAGIDVVLPRYSGSDAARRTWARTGLERLTQALKERRADGRSYPLVGMMVDTDALRAVDLTSDDGKRLLYGMIREFFLRVPREFWAQVGARTDDLSPGGVPVLLGSPMELAAWDGSFLDFCQQRFAEDWPGGRIVWLGGSEWRSQGAEGFHSYVSLPTQVSFAQSTPGSAPVVALSPGYQPPPQQAGEIRSRRDGRPYRNDWQRALAAQPEMVIINSWNDFANGTEIAPSRQYGVAYVDATRYFQARIGSEQEYSLWLKQRRLPAVMKPGADYQAEFVVENAGTDDIRTGRRTTVNHQIVRRSDGRLVQHKIGAQSLVIAAGQTLRLPAVISTKDDAGEPLPPGEYVFSLTVTRSKVAYLRSRWFTQKVAEIEMPISVGAPPAQAASVISTSLPSSMQTGAALDTMVRLRNDGGDPWRKGDVLLSYHWVRHIDELGRPSSETREVVARGVARAELPRDVAPGEAVSVLIPVSAVTNEGLALPAVRSDDLRHYRVQWDLVTKDGVWFSANGRPMAEEAIQVVARASGAVVRSVDARTEMEAGEQTDVTVTTANAGSEAWTADGERLRYRWFRWDGRALAPATIAPASLPAGVAPGESTDLAIRIEAPSSPGNYWLEWGTLHGADEGAGAGSDPSADSHVSPVLVSAAAMRPIDLSSFTNVAAITTDAFRARGDFDGRGRSWPAEWAPPDRSGAREGIYQSGYYCPEDAAEPVPFVFADTSSGIADAIACAGQSIPLGSHGMARVHLLAASTAGTGEAALGLERASGDMEEVSVVVPSWTERAEGVPLGLYTPYLRGLSGDDPGTAGFLYRLTLASPSGEAVSLRLPRAPWIKILAITVEDA